MVFSAKDVLACVDSISMFFLLGLWYVRAMDWRIAVYHQHFDHDFVLLL